MSQNNSTKSVQIAPYLFQREKDFFYNPPVYAVKAGAVKRKGFKDREQALVYAAEQHKLLNEWRANRGERKKTLRVRVVSTVQHLIEEFYESPSFTLLAPATKESYKMYLGFLEGKGILKQKLVDVTTPMLQRVYDIEVKNRGIASANYIVRIYSILFNFAIRNGYITHNPFRYIKKQKMKERKEMWDRSHVRAFLNVAFSNFEWRNIGIVIYMMYEWGQRPSDMLKLKWTSIDWENQTATIHQSKRGAIVKLPITNGLFDILKQQYRDFGHQEYVAPSMRKRYGKYPPYSVSKMNELSRKIMEEAKVPQTLQLRDLRRTAITESLEGGAEIIHIMQMSGHRSMHSLTPYIVHTLKGSTKAQEMRQFPDRLLEQ